jgi:sialate O-acetylesterase
MMICRIMSASLIRSCLLVSSVLAFSLSTAQLRFDPVFSDHMVLQRDRPIRIFGTANPGAPVLLRFADHEGRSSADVDGHWLIELPARRADTMARDLQVISGIDTITLRDLLVGDIWLCIGQSNMEWPMQREAHFAEERVRPMSSILRWRNPDYAGKGFYGTPFTPQVVRRLQADSFYQGDWTRADTRSLPMMSAVAYYAGRTLTDRTGVPVGLINLSIGGAPLETFINPEAIAVDPRFASKIKGDWLENADLPDWVKVRGRQNVGDLPGVPSGPLGKAHPFRPGFAYEGGIKPLLDLPIRGILCYQGESNAQEPARVGEYGALTRLMVEDLRSKWSTPDMPFYFVQLSSIDTIKYKGQLWPEFRDEQRRMLDSIPHSGMAVCTDIGARDDVHPTEKRLVGQRLAQWILRDVHGMVSVPSGPLPVRAVWKRGSVIVHFQYTGSRLKTADMSDLRGFALDGNPSNQVQINGKTVVIEAKEKPRVISYGWQSWSNGNLVNEQGLPASTFRIPVR